MKTLHHLLIGLYFLQRNYGIFDLRQEILTFHNISMQLKVESGNPTNAPTLFVAHALSTHVESRRNPCTNSESASSMVSWCNKPSYTLRIIQYSSIQFGNFSSTPFAQRCISKYSVSILLINLRQKQQVRKKCFPQCLQLKKVYTLTQSTSDIP